MKSIKEKSVEYGKDWYIRKVAYSERCRGCYAHVLSSYETGANYVLEEIEKVVQGDLNSHSAFKLKCIKQIIEELKK